MTDEPHGPRNSTPGGGGSGPGEPTTPAPPDQRLIERQWQKGPNRRRILHWAGRLSDLAPPYRALFDVALRLEEGELPQVEQNGTASFDPVEFADHRILRVQAEEGVDSSHGQNDRAASGSAEGTAGGSTGSAEGAAGWSTSSEAPEAEARETVRRSEAVRRYANVGEVMDEDWWELGVMFPQFSPPIYDLELQMWFLEGWLQPLAWWPERFGVRLYYEPDPGLLHMVRIAPTPPPNAPHQFLNQRNDRRFFSVCYTFPSDGTVVRGRGWDDTATEVLRQVVVWLLRYMVWKHFAFYPGEDVGHDPRLLLNLVSPDDPCPYHSNRRYGACCRSRHLAEAGRMPPLAGSGGAAAASY